MIISERIDKNNTEFEALLSRSCKIIKNAINNNDSYFMRRSATELENDIFDSLCEAAKGTDFDRTIYLISGHKFPDIVVKKYFGVEVKTTKQDFWKSIGNSVLESTRVESVGRIYLFFAKLTDPISFKYRLYQECLYDIAVTHSPRYLIDMDLKLGESIFDKIGVSYDELRTKENPIKKIVSYYRSISKQGEEPWWMDNGEAPELAVKPMVSLWSKLPKTDKIKLRNEAMARFPELFGKSSEKYQKMASWLAARYGIVDSSLRDRFSAGGKVNLNVGGVVYKSLPRVFLHLMENAHDIIQDVRHLSPEEAKYYWDLSFEPASVELLMTEWSKKVIYHSEQLFCDSEKFIVHLLAITFPEKLCPSFINERKKRYGV